MADLPIKKLRWPALVLVAVLVGVSIACAFLYPFVGFSLLPRFTQDGAAWVQAIGSVFAIFVAIGIAARQSKEDHKHRALAALPHLAIERTVREDEPRMKLVVRNDGLGPAILTAFKVYVDGEIVRADSPTFWLDVFNQIGLTSGSNSGGLLYAIGNAVPVGKPRMLARYHPTQHMTVTNEQLFEAFNRVSFHVRYKSVYGEEFTYGKQWS